MGDVPYFICAGDFNLKILMELDNGARRHTMKIEGSPVGWLRARLRWATIFMVRPKSVIFVPKWTTEKRKLGVT